MTLHMVIIDKLLPKTTNNNHKLKKENYQLLQNELKNKKSEEIDINSRLINYFK